MAIKFTISKEKILEALQRVQSVVGPRTTLPILSNARLQAEEGAVHLTTTDLDISVRCTVPANITKEGATTVPVRKFFSVIKELPSQDIDIEVDDRNATSIHCGTSFYKMMGLPEEEFPRFPQVGGGTSLKMEKQELADMLKKTSYAISNDETRYVLNGLYMSFKDEKATIVATDGRRLALIEREVEMGKEGSAEFIVPAKAVTELQRLLTGKGNVQLAIGQNQIIAEVEGATLASKLIEGTFPDFRQVIPKEAKERITLERELLQAALHRAALFANEKTQSVKLQFTKNNLTITANTPEVGEARETLAMNYKGKDFSIAFNPQYMMDPLRNLDADEIFLEVVDELSPGVIKVNEPFLYVLMPMRLS